MRTVSALLVLLTLSCAGLVVYEQQEMDTLYFGTQKPDGGVVSDAEWQQFLADEITTRFPSGLTTWDASGQWRDAHNVIERERTHIVQVVHPVSREEEERLDAIIALYQKRFAQEAVFRVRSDVWLPR
ncbi:MAG TPA: DUF3574 domain-containing protein [Thermoanaerobaculia bacterium]|jgi:hypothetical protein|nr:DUF3574 domain-containing protein [Thermoanaerobaculia bacterium]